MSSELLISWVSTAVAVFTAIVLAIKAFRTTPGERADVATRYEEMANRQAEQINKLKGRIDELETSLQTMETKITEWQHGVALLIHQIEAGGQTPIWKPKDTGELKKK